MSYQALSAEGAAEGSQGQALSGAKRAAPGSKQAFDKERRRRDITARVLSLFQSSEDSLLCDPGATRLAPLGAVPLATFWRACGANKGGVTFDIRTSDGFKLYRIRQTYDANFGTLNGNTPNTLPRYI